MEGFSRSDQLKAILSPFCCCLNRNGISLSPSSDSLNNQSSDPSSSPHNRDWDSQTRSRDQEGDSEWTRANRTREDDLLSLHEGIGRGGEGSRLRLRGRGGDVSGGGASEGSGLTRWTLFKSWWRGGVREGAIRLEDDGEEGILDVEVENRERQGDEQRSAQTFALEEDGPSAVASKMNELEIGSNRSQGSSRSEGTTVVGDVPNDREARRARRRARRARELGISTEEFEQGVIAEPNELESTTNFLDVRTGSHHRSGKSKKSSKASSRTSSSDSRSRDQDHALHQSLPVLEEEEDRHELSVYGSVLKSRSKKGSHHSVSSEGDRRSNGSSRSRRHLAEQIDPHLVPLPISPRPEVAHASSHDSPKRPRHRSQPSTSTVSSSSTSRRPKKQPHLSPLHDYAEEPIYSLQGQAVEYYQDEHGQLRPYLREPESTSSHPIDDPATSTPSYDHIGLLPPFSPSEEPTYSIPSNP